VHFTTVGVRVPSLSQTNLLPKPMSPKKKPRDMRERAILNHAYTNPQFHQSSGKILFVALVFNILHVPLFYLHFCIVNHNFTCFQIQLNLSKLNLLGIKFCVRNGQVFSLYKLNKQRFPALGLYLRFSLCKISGYLGFSLCKISGYLGFHCGKKGYGCK